MKTITLPFISGKLNASLKIKLCFAVMLFQSLNPLILKSAIKNHLNSNKIGINVGEWCPPELTLMPPTGLEWSANCTIENTSSVVVSGLKLRLALYLPMGCPNPDFVYVTEVLSYGNEPDFHLPLYIKKEGNGISNFNISPVVAGMAESFTGNLNSTTYTWRGFESINSFSIDTNHTENYRVVFAWKTPLFPLPSCRYFSGHMFNADNTSTATDLLSWDKTTFNPNLPPTTEMLYHKKNTTITPDGEIHAFKRCVPTFPPPPTAQPYFALTNGATTDSNNTGLFINRAAGTYTCYCIDTIAIPQVYVDSAIITIAHNRLFNVRNQIACGSYTWSPLGGGGGTYDSSGVYSVQYTGPPPNFQPFDSVLNLVVHKPPTVSTSATLTTICVAQSTTITASGADTYLWQPGALSGTSITVSPTVTTTYTVTGTNTATGCTNTAIITIAICPTISQWGLIILCLISLALGVIFISKRQPSVAFAGASENYTSGNQSLFKGNLFLKVYAIILGISIVGLGISFIYFGSVTVVDTLGTIVSASIVAYIIHYLLLLRQKNKSQFHNI